jgi:hypothetical protein
MATMYEFWQHRTTGDVWAVKLSDGRVVGVTEIRRDDVNSELLPHLPYRTTDAANFEKRRDDFRRTDGRKVA